MVHKYEVKKAVELGAILDKVDGKLTFMVESKDGVEEIDALSLLNSIVGYEVKLIANMPMGNE